MTTKQAEEGMEMSDDVGTEPSAEDKAAADVVIMKAIAPAPPGLRHTPTITLSIEALRTYVAEAIAKARSERSPKTKQGRGG